MGETELAWLECGPRVGLRVFKTDPRTVPSLIKYLHWRYGILAPFVMTAWALGAGTE